MDRDTYYRRTSDVLHPQKLADRRVVVVGVGSGGARVAEELARVGVGQIVLIDRPGEVLEEHNIVRQPLGYGDLGKPKVQALRERLRDINRWIEVELSELDVRSDPQQLRSICEKSHLVALCTDNEPSRFVVNEVAVNLGIPMVFASVFDGGCGGEIGRYLPGQACYACIATRLGRGAPMEEVPATPDYSSPNPLGERSTSALNLDITQISLLQARFCILTLLQPDSHDPELPANYLVVGNRRVEGLFKGMLDHEFIPMDRLEDCLVCGRGPNDTIRDADYESVLASAEVSEVNQPKEP